MKYTKHSDHLTRMVHIRGQIQLAIRSIEIDLSLMENEGAILQVIELRPRVEAARTALSLIDEEINLTQLLHEADILTGNYTEPFASGGIVWQSPGDEPPH